MPQNRYVTAKRLAQLLGVDVRTVHRMVTDGRITPAMQGPGTRGAYFFDPADIDRLVAAERQALADRAARLSGQVPA